MASIDVTTFSYSFSIVTDDNLEKEKLELHSYHSLWPVTKGWYEMCHRVSRSKIMGGG